MYRSLRSVDALLIVTKQPPELLSSILQQCSELSNDLWPTPEDPPTDKDDYRANIRSGMDGVQGLYVYAFYLLALC